MTHTTATTAHHRPRWWTELALLALVYVAYSAGRLLARGDVSTAVDNGLAILRAERLVSLDFETPLNRLFTEHAAIGVPADFVYASLHYLVTPAILVWLFRRRPLQYRAARTWLMVSTLLGLVGFILMPTCPPRLLEAGQGFVDTMAQYSSYGWWGAEASAPRGMGGFTNQYAAMPSLHVGWALWCGVLLWRYGRTPLMRTLAVAYPLVTVIVVMGTANHYFLDAAAGAAVMGAGLLLAKPAMRLADRVRVRFARGGAAAPAAAGAPVVGGGCHTSTGERIPGQRTSSAAGTTSTTSTTSTTTSTTITADTTSTAGASPDAASGAVAHRSHAGGADDAASAAAR
ncbi:phosphatase PAP2 family protein [Streptomyces qinzhouensis]|uniref:Phosphatase PAP2 family protein n=1 Tax=Streptomyces qinzhouensis TaxID=2599401 RepID=A0A5B8IFF3_9ACTN|nr:phosphatase PAP2 family protein [Streptomyces qinzhouensis]QDY76872.1 phosphatase PAP2 family protein [Streptomyces qinzhouensis]